MNERILTADLHKIKDSLAKVGSDGGWERDFNLRENDVCLFVLKKF